MHDTFQLQRALKKDENTEKFDPEVIAADGVLPLVKETPNRYLIIGNTDPKGFPGTHWVLFFRRSSSHPPIFFDSYGKNPSYYYPGWMFFDSHRRSKEDFQQEDTTVCGDFCLYVARRVAAGYSLQTVLESFQPEDQKHNDEMVFSLVHRRFKFLNKTGHGRVVKKQYIQNCQVCRATKIS